VKTTVQSFGRLDCAHNNAGVLGPVGELLECSAEDYHRVVAVNLTGVWHCMQAEIAQMLEQAPPPGAHSIVNTASVAGLVGSPLVPAYCAAKHAVVGLTKSAARTYGPRGVRINCVCPGPIEVGQTPVLFHLPDDFRFQHCPGGRIVVISSKPAPGGMTQGGPAIPQVCPGKSRLHHLHPGAGIAHQPEAGLAEVKHARFHGEITAEIAQPADFLLGEVARTEIGADLVEGDGLE